MKELLRRIEEALDIAERVILLHPVEDVDKIRQAKQFLSSLRSLLEGGLEKI